MGLARYIERAGALALALGVAIAMSAEPLVAHATRGERAGINPTGVVSGILVALRRRPSANTSSRSPSGRPLIELVRSVFRRGDRPSATSAAPVIAGISDEGDAVIAPVHTVAGVGPVRDIAISADGRYAYVADFLRHRHMDGQGCRHSIQHGAQDHRRSRGRHPDESCGQSRFVSALRRRSQCRHHPRRRHQRGQPDPQPGGGFASPGGIVGRRVRHTRRDCPQPQRITALRADDGLRFRSRGAHPRSQRTRIGRNRFRR